MKKFIKIKRNSGMTCSNFLQGHPEYSRGMSYVELIVVLSIFSAMSSVVIFNYGEFQAKVDIRNLASDIALKIVEAQKASLAGELPPLVQQTQINSAWKPSYGIYIDRITDNKSFMYFSDLNQDGNFVDTACSQNGECLDKIIITKGNTISGLDVYYRDDVTPDSLEDVTITFKRPDSRAIINSSTLFTDIISYIQITISSPSGASAVIKLYPSGRIQVN